MRMTVLLPILVLATVLALAPRTGWGANADHPYQNVDPSNDKGNNTGDAKVEDLNASQLDENQKPPAQPPSVVFTQPGGGVTTQGVVQPAR
jgi:hypothetical protein